MNATVWPLYLPTDQYEVRKTYSRKPAYHWYLFSLYFYKGLLNKYL